MASGLMKSLIPKFRLHPVQVEATAIWGTAIVTAAVFVVQPFDWLKKTFTAEPEKK